MKLHGGGGALVLAIGMAALLPALALAARLTTIEYEVKGGGLSVSPAALSVPKGIAGSILTTLPLAEGYPNAIVEASLRGPSFPARRLIARPNEALLLPPLNLVGDYQLDSIRLLDEATGATLLEGTPNTVPVLVFDEVLISRVTSRPLTIDEITERGIVIDQDNFRAVEFEVGFVLDGQTIPVRFPVVAPAFHQSTEIIPAAELQARLVEAEALNREIAASVELPPELETARFNIEIQGINFQVVEEEEVDLALSIPPIPALMVVPGRIGFLNQFFSVQIFTENGAPQGSGLSVMNVQAALKLPPGPDLVTSTDYNAPGDDPLRFARVGANQVISPTQPVVRPGLDGVVGTPDDIARLQPGESGQGEFLVEGLQEGLHVMDVDLTADLEGLAAGVVKVKGKAAGSVLVRNPKFSMAFSHPRTVRAGEPYEAFVTILNTGHSPANLVQVALAAASIGGGVLESPESVELGTILPGQTATAKFRIRSQRTGAITFSNLTTSDESVVGRFRLRAGVDERGVALSPDTIILPDFAHELPQRLLDAANRVLGQALSVATAGQVPAGVLNVPRSIMTRRVLEMAEAGQRLRYHDDPERVLADLLLDWQGGRNFNIGFDQILRETDAGREFREAIMREIEDADVLDATERLAARAGDFAGRGEPWLLASADDSSLEIALHRGAEVVTLDRSQVVQGLAYRGAYGHWLVAMAGTNDVVEWRASQTLAQAELSVLELTATGTGRRLSWTVVNPPTNACLRYTPGAGTGLLEVDENCDGSVDTLLGAQLEAVIESSPAVVAVIQDQTVNAGGPTRKCVSAVPLSPDNYGTVLAVLFSKPMIQEKVNVPAAYTLENGNVAGSVQVQPGGRVALLNMRRPLGGLIPRTLTVSGVTDPRDHPITNAVLPVETDLTAGVAIRGRVARADGSPAAGVPVTLTMYDQSQGIECQSFVVRVSQVLTDASGFFDFDFVMSGVPYSISATDTGSLTPEALQLIMQAAGDDRIQTERLLELANSPSAQDTLLQAFAVGALPEAIAIAENLDRALLRDLIPEGSPREGTTVPVALRFRGRAVVAGTVVTANGSTPLSGVAVNLFPDPDSREQGRGVFTDGSGRFAFYGVPLGLFTVQARTDSGLYRTISDVIDENGQTKDLMIALGPSNTVVTTMMAGRVTEADGVTPHGGGQVFVGRNDGGGFGSVVAITTADADGYWSAEGIPVGYHDVIAVSLDGKRKGSRTGILASAGSTATANISLQGRAVVHGRVETSIGLPVGNAIVGGGEVLVRSDTNGFFTLEGVPTGPRTISVGVERTTNFLDPKSIPPFEFPRLGSAGVNVLPGDDNYVVVRIGSAGRIVGRVISQNGNPVPNATVAIPQRGGFMWADADANGNYRFENLDLGSYELSAPSPPVNRTEVEGLLEILANKNSGEGEIPAAIGEAFAIFTGLTDPFLNGDAEHFNPLNWGFNRTAISFDGQTAVADIRFLPVSTIAGQVLNGQGVPIGARVRLTGIGPAPNGASSFIIRGERNTDPALGTFDFTQQALVGDWGLQAASPFYPVVISTAGRTTTAEPNEPNVILQFPPTREVNGRLMGTVYQPDGRTPAGSNLNVHISFSDDYVIHTRADGTYDTQIALPAGGYSVEVTDPITGLRGISSVNLLAGITNRCDVILVGKGSIAIQVNQADGTPAAGASVDAQQGSYPSDHFSGTADTNGFILFQNVFAGPYGVCASKVSGPTTLYGRNGVTVNAGATGTVTVTLGATASIRGTFVKRDLVTPVAFAQVAVGGLGYTTTDSNGVFAVEGIPLGSYRLTSQDPVSGIGASANVTLSFNGQTNTVVLVEQSRGEVRGRVINSFGTGFVPGATVSLSMQDGLSPTRAVTTGPQGDFSFPGTPAGAFGLWARDPVSGLPGGNNGILGEDVALVEINISLQPLGHIAGQVFEPDGVTPATNAVVALGNQYGTPLAYLDCDSTGRVAFANLAFGYYLMQANSLRLDESRSVGVTGVLVNVVNATSEFRMVLSGVGRIEGTVRQSDGVTPAIGAVVELSGVGAALSDDVGHFEFGNVAVGPYRVSAFSLALGASHNGSITNAGQMDEVTLVLSASGVVTGHLVRADGATPMPDTEVLLTFPSLSGLPGRATARTGADGGFGLSTIPVGGFNLEAIAASVAGIARLTSTLTNNGQILDLGLVRLDEDDPRVVEVAPPDTTAGVSISTAVDLLFNEALNSNSVNVGGVFMRLADSVANLPVSLQFLPDPTGGVRTLVRLTPLAPLQSERTFEVVVLDGERLNALGQVTATGPRDMVSRPLVAPFLSRFTTRDKEPPRLLSFTPTNREVQINPRSIVRLSFNEPVNATGITFTLSGSAGAIPGRMDVGVNNLVLAFTPSNTLPVNAAFTAEVFGITDLAGNLATGQPFRASFQTLDTIGPSISNLRIKNNTQPVAGGLVEFEIVLTAPETNASVRMSADFVTFGQSNPGDLDLPYTLPASGSLTIRAIAIDQYGNEGPFAELLVTVIPNAPPQIQVTRINPASGPVPSGGFISVDVSATDAGGVTQLVAAMSGALTAPLKKSVGATLRLQGFVPMGAGPAPMIQVVAEAHDNSGVSSGQQILLIEVSDGTAPAGAILAPAEGTEIVPGGTVPVLVRATDNFGVAQVQVETDGAFTAAVAAVVSPASTGAVVSINLPVPTGVPPDGAPVTVTARAVDSSGRTSTATSVSLRMKDLTPPAVISLLPTNGAEGVSLTPFIQAVFSETIATATVSAATVRLTEEATGSNVAASVVISNDLRSLRVVPVGALLPDSLYRISIATNVTDRAGNGLTGEVFSVFRTGRFRILTPTNGTFFVEGQSITVEAESGNEIGMASVRFLVNTGAIATVGSAPYRVAYTVPGTNVLGGSSLLLSAEGLGPSSELLSLAQVTCTILTADGDQDGDGMSNGDELRYGTDPFVADADQDPDGDGLTSGAEVAAGLHPRNPDTDGDGIPDGVDPVPLVANRLPQAGTPAASAALDFDGVDDYLQIPSSAAIDLAGEVTVEAFVRTTQNSSPSGEAILLEKGVGGNHPYSLRLLIPSGRVAFTVGDGAQTVSVISSSAVNDGAWHHVAAVRSGTNFARLYLDGALVSIAADLPLNPGSLANGQPLFMGRRSGSVLNNFAGELDEVRIWNRALDATEIRQRMLRSLTGGETGLVAWFHLDEQSGDTAYDQSAGLHDGRLGGGTPAAMPAWVAAARTNLIDPAYTASVTADVALVLSGFDGDGEALTARVLSLPAHGQLFQTVDGVARGAEITAVPAVVTDGAGRLLYAVGASAGGRDAFLYEVNDAWQTSAVATVELAVLITNLPPVAAADTRETFEDTPITISGLTTNDSDPEGDTIRIALLGQPNHGTAMLNGDGTVTYTPAAGYHGSDSFSYVAYDGTAWNRFADYSPGMAHVSLAGNPATDAFGFPVWELSYTRGDDLGGAMPWFAGGRTRMIWDGNGMGAFGPLWARGDDVPPVLFRESLANSIESQDRFEHPPAVSWVSPFDGAHVDVAGALTVSWQGVGGVGRTVDVDVVIATRSEITGVVTPRLTNSVSEPPGGIVRLPVALTDLTLDRGDEIVMTCRARRSVPDRYILMTDDLVIVPHAEGRTATVTVQVGSNRMPRVQCQLPGTALTFDGVNDYVRVPDHANSSTSLTVALWARSDTPTWNRYGFLASKREAYVLHPWEGGKRVSFFVRNDAGPWTEATFTPSFDITGWHHYAGTFDGQNIRLYMDGELVATTPHASPITADTGPLFLGYDDTPPRYLNGGLDEVSVWDVTLSRAQIASNMFAKLTGAEAGLRGYWSFDDGASTNAHDLSTNALHGVLGGGDAAAAPLWVEAATPFDQVPTTPEDTDLTLTLGGEDDDGDTLTAVVTALPLRGTLYQTANGITRGVALATVPALVTDADRRVIYAPEANFSGADSLAHLVTDGKVQSGSCTTWLRIVPVNDAPVAGHDTAFTLREVPITIVNVLTNDTDTEADPLSVLDFTPASHGMVETNGNGSFLYTPAVGFTGVDTFTYRATDGQTNSAPATVTITVNPSLEFHWVNAAGGNWSVGSNWDRGTAPGMDDWAYIDLPGTYTVTVDSAATVFRLLLGTGGDQPTLRIAGPTLTVRQSMASEAGSVFRIETGAAVLDGASSLHQVELSGTLGGMGLITVLDRMDWTGGDMRGEGRTVLAAGSVLTATNTDPKYLYESRVLVLNTPVTWKGGSLMIKTQTGRAGLENNATLTFEGAAGVALELPYGFSYGFFTNNGVLVKTGLGTTTDINVPFTQNGSVQVMEGALSVNAWGTVNGLVDVSTSATMRATSLDFSPTSELRGSGGMVFEGGTSAFAGQFSLTGPLTISATANFNQDANVNELILSGTLGGMGLITVLDRMDWTGGDMRGEGRTVLAAGSVLTATNTDPKYLYESRVLVLNTPVTWKGGSLMIKTQTGRAGLENNDTLTFEGATAVILELPYGFSYGFFTNNGVLVKTGLGTTTDINVPFTQNGSVQVMEGALSVNAWGTVNGLVDVSTSATMRATSLDFSPTSELRGSGGMVFEGGTSAFAGQFSLTGPLTISATANFNQDANVNELILSGTLGGMGLITVLDRMDWTGGDMRGEGRTVLAAGSVLTATNTLPKYLYESRVLVLNTPVTWKGGSLVMKTQTGRTALENNATLTFEGAAGVALELPYGFSYGFFTNNGVLVKTGLGTTTDINVPFTQNGSVQVMEGALQIQGGGANNSTVDVAAAASLVLNSVWAQTPAARLNGAGAYVVNSPLTLDHDVAIRQVILNNYLGGSGTVTLLDRLDWTAGDMRGEGRTVLAAGSVLTATNTLPKYLYESRVLVLNTPVTWKGGSLVIKTQTGCAALENNDTLTFEGATGVALELPFGHTHGNFTNNGALVKSGTGTTSAIDVPFTQNGGLQVREGTLSLNAGGHLGGDYVIASNAILRLDGGAFSLVPTSFTGPGTLQIRTPITLLSDVDFADVQVVFENAASVAGNFLLTVGANGSMLFNKSMTIPGSVRILDQGTLSLVNNTTVVTISNILTLESGGTINNPGTLQAGGFVNNGGAVIGNAVVVIGGLAPAGVFYAISPPTLGATGAGTLVASSDRLVTVHWRGRSGKIFVVEWASGLQDWQRAGALSEEVKRGVYQATVSIPGDPSPIFFRLLEIAP